VGYLRTSLFVVVFILIVLACGALALAGIFFFANNPLTSSSSGGDYVAYFAQKGLWQEGSTNRSVSNPREIGPNVSYVVMQETLGSGPDAMVKTSDAYVNLTSGEVVVAGSYVTSPDWEKEKWDLLVQELDPSSIER
jgi:hypothetical protein